MKTRSAKNKGKRLQNDVRDLILSKFPTLTPDDVKSTTMGESGADIQLSTEGKRQFPYSIECKNQEAISIWKCLEQTESNVHPNTKPLLIFKRNRSKTYVVMEINDFFNVI